MAKTTEGEQHHPDHDKHDPQSPQKVDPEDEPEDQQQNTQQDHGGLLGVALGTIRTCVPDRGRPTGGRRGSMSWTTETTSAWASPRGCL